MAKGKFGSKLKAGVQKLAHNEQVGDALRGIAKAVVAKAAPGMEKFVGNGTLKRKQNETEAAYNERVQNAAGAAMVAADLNSETDKIGKMKQMYEKFKAMSTGKKVAIILLPIAVVVMVVRYFKNRNNTKSKSQRSY